MDPALATIDSEVVSSAYSGKERAAMLRATRSHRSPPRWESGQALLPGAGRVWSELGKRDPGPIHAGAAAGLRVAWNRNFVIRFDYGIGISEPFANGNVYLTFDEMF